MTMPDPAEVTVDVGDDFVAEIEIHRPPANFFDVGLIEQIADAVASLQHNSRCRSILLCSEGKHFCAGASFDPADGQPRGSQGLGANALYEQAVRLFEYSKPIVAAVQGAAIGGGLGLACAADFRVAASETRFSANFARLGFHHGFGLSVTLPLVIGHTKAIDLLYTGRRVDGVEAYSIGLCDRLVPLAEIRSEAREVAATLARSAPLAVQSIRKTMRGDLAARVRVATEHEGTEQIWLRKTADFSEGVVASEERRDPVFHGD
jgi:2-(1,2-epoxy-1,2-dihydrophenyl)acetyl-CoA isomerase